MTDSTILQILAKYPTGLKGIEVRFALQMHNVEFEGIIQQELTRETIQASSLQDLDDSLLQIRTSLLVTTPELITISHWAFRTHEILQQYPSGLSELELSNKLGGTTAFQSELNSQVQLGFIDESSDLNSIYRTKIHIPLRRLVTPEDKPSTLLAPIQHNPTISITAGLIITILSYLLLI